MAKFMCEILNLMLFESKLSDSQQRKQCGKNQWSKLIKVYALVERINKIRFKNDL